MPLPTLRHLCRRALLPGSTVYVDAGIYGDAVTIDVPGLTLLGANAYCDARSANRTAAESVISGELNVTADNVTINGFRFTGAGQYCPK